MRRRLACVFMATALAAVGKAMAAGPTEPSADGRWLVAADGQGIAVYDLGVRVKTLAATSRDGRNGPSAVAADGQGIAVYDRGIRVKTLAATSRDGRNGPSAVATIRHVGARHSFVIAFETLAELWELSVDPLAAPIFDGLVHDYRMAEGIAEPGYLGVRRTRLEVPLHELAFDDSGAFVVGRAAREPGSHAVLHLVQLDIRRMIGRFVIGGDPDLAAAQTLQLGGRRLLSVPDRLGGPPALLDLRQAQRVEPAEPGKAAKPLVGNVFKGDREVPASLKHP